VSNFAKNLNSIINVINSKRVANFCVNLFVLCS